MTAVLNVLRRWVDVALRNQDHVAQAFAAVLVWFVLRIVLRDSRVRRARKDAKKKVVPVAHHLPKAWSAPLPTAVQTARILAIQEESESELEAEQESDEDGPYVWR